MKKNRKKKQVKRHIKIKPFLILLGCIFIVLIIGFYIFNLPIKNIYINGNYYVTDYEILGITGLKEYPNLFKYSSNKIRNNILKIDQIANAKVKKSLFGKVTIEITEARVLFYNRSNNTYVLSNKKILDKTNINVPLLINYVPNTIYDRLIESFESLNDNTLSLISEIEYSPSRSGDTIIDDTRFLLRMIDGNNVYINLINIERLNMYLDISTIFETKGTLGLDSDNGQVVFNAF